MVQKGLNPGSTMHSATMGQAKGALYRPGMQQVLKLTVHYSKIRPHWWTWEEILIEILDLCLTLFDFKQSSIRQNNQNNAFNAAKARAEELDAKFNGMGSLEFIIDVRPKGY